MTDTFSNCIHTAKAELLTAKKLLNAEISAYPAPIAGCDAQFNHLIGERQKVLDALRTLEDRECHTPHDIAVSVGSRIHRRRGRIVISVPLR